MRVEHCFITTSALFFLIFSFVGFSCNQEDRKQNEGNLEIENRKVIVKYYHNFDLQSWVPSSESGKSCKDCWRIEWQDDSVRSVSRSLPISNKSRLEFLKNGDKVEYRMRNPVRDFRDQFIFSETNSTPFLRKICYHKTIIEWIAFDPKILPVRRVIFFKNKTLGKYEIGRVSLIQNDTLRQIKILKKFENLSFTETDARSLSVILNLFTQLFGPMDLKSSDHVYYYEEDRNEWPFWLSDQCDG